MRKCRGRGRVSQIVCRDIDGLHRRDRAVGGRGDALLQRAHFLRQRRLIADGGWHAAKQRRNLAACLHKAENVVDEQQNVLLFGITKIFGHRQTGKRYAHAHAGRFVHLSEDQRRLLQHTAPVHFVPEVIALAAALADAGEDGIAAVLRCDVVNEFLNEHRFADACAAEQTNLAALWIRLQQVDDLDACLQQFCCRALFRKNRGLAVNFPLRCLTGQGTLAVDGFAQYVKHPAKRCFTDWYLNAGAGRLDRHAA